jgi:hypothetical protein
MSDVVAISLILSGSKSKGCPYKYIPSFLNVEKLSKNDLRNLLQKIIFVLQKPAK